LSTVMTQRHAVTSDVAPGRGKLVPLYRQVELLRSVVSMGRNEGWEERTIHEQTDAKKKESTTVWKRKSDIDKMRNARKGPSPAAYPMQSWITGNE
jgi:hypothetical protein